MKLRLPITAIAVCAALAAAAPAAADGPDRISVEVDRTRVIPASETGCGFDIVRPSEGTFYITTFYNADGTVARQVLRVSSYKVTDTNPLSGKSVTSALAGPVVIEPNADGTTTVTIPGNGGHLMAPDEGVIWSNVGRIVYVADASDPVTPLRIVSVNGLYTDLTGPYPEVCAALA
jgi:hypothetical protein